MKPSEIYFELYPNELITYKTLIRISNVDTTGVYKYLDPEDYYFTKQLYKRKLYKKKEVKQTLLKILRKEKNEIEKMIYKMLLGKKILFEDYEVKLSFINSFPKFKKNFIDSNNSEYILQKAINEHYQHSANVKEIVEKNILKISKKKIYIYTFFLHSILQRETIEKIIKIVDDSLKLSVMEMLPKHDYYKQLAMYLLSAKPEIKVSLITDTEKYDKQELFKVLVKICMKNITLDKLYFKEFLEIMRLVNAGFHIKTKLLCAWLRTFIYLKRIPDFIKLYKQLVELDVKNEDMIVSEEFYISICNYKRYKYLDLDNFLKLCKDVQEANEFAVYEWKDMYRIYKE